MTKIKAFIEYHEQTVSSIYKGPPKMSIRNIQDLFKEVTLD